MLGTGSSGNAIVLEADGSHILVDAGLPIRNLVRRLASIGVAPQDIEAVVLTHEHADHACSALSGVRMFGWRLVATPGTLRADPDLAAVGAESLRAGDTMTLSTMDIATIPVPHDAAAPIAVTVTARRSGMRTGVAYDFGRVTDTIRRGLARLDVLIVESNHDDVLLQTGPYPRSVAKRIAGPCGHLSNAQAADLVRSVVHRGLARIVLAHLSENCNEPALAMRTMVDAVARTRSSRIPVNIAAQGVVTGPFGDVRSTQLTLGI